MHNLAAKFTILKKRQNIKFPLADTVIGGKNISVPALDSHDHRVFWFPWGFYRKNKAIIEGSSAISTAPMSVSLLVMIFKDNANICVYGP